MKKTQTVMIWLLPLIIIGGLFEPVLGYLVVAMMAFFLILSFFRGRYWCWNLCPRGAFLDAVISKVSRNKLSPKKFSESWFRWLVFFLFMAFLIFRIIKTGGSAIAIGAVFVSMCIITTVISVILGVITKHRSWCLICPMGMLQDKIGSFKKTPQANPKP
ncbi:MAG: 4Fe-4S binding protein [Candidatus Omnitrophica bacterium]|nr:4Fe-4S binding protein [Candidatus Omnitrophota bacterium]MDD5237543.1 4Fe-4S binding protein [Candidatus Omnitrophota bacterium]